MEQAWINLADATWTVRAEPSADAFAEVPAELQAQLREGIPATVPGCVHTDLLAVGLIADPYVGTAEADQHWVGRQTWTYSGHFDVAQDSPLLDSEHIDLTCDGLDTVADVYCNGHLLGHSENMHRRNLFSAKSALVAGANVVEVVFAPALEYAERMAALVGERIHVERDPYNLVRKMACNFGWDWGPRVVTAGIWKTIGLRGWNTARVLDAVVRATARQTEEGTWTGHLEVDVQLTGKLRFAAVTVRVTGNDARATVGVVADEWTQASVDVSGIEPWWPHTLGEQPMYDVEILLHSDVAVLDRVHKRTGFRTVALDTTPDADGNGAKFGLVLNGEEIFVRGANWIPDDCFVTRVTPERYRERIQQARDANIDLLRIWGGGIYETEAFYEACDELGMMVWQDFCLACAAYPEEEPFWSEFEAEARDNVMRLSAYPSLVVWNGNNENIWGRVDWDWASKPGGDRTWGAGYYYDLFPRVLAELDPSRPYWHGSPSSGSPDLHPNDPNYGCIHIWDVWNDRDYTGYDDYSPRFVSEFGYQGPATYATWARALDPADRGATTAAMLVHQKAAGGNDKLNAGIAGHLPQPGETVPDFDEWLYLMQLQQANAVRYGIDRWRSLRLDRVAAQRLLAGHLLGRAGFRHQRGGGDRGPPQAAVVRAAFGLRRPPAQLAVRGSDARFSWCLAVGGRERRTRRLGAHRHNRAAPAHRRGALVAPLGRPCGRTRTHRGRPAVGQSGADRARSGSGGDRGRCRAPRPAPGPGRRGGAARPRLRDRGRRDANRCAGHGHCQDVPALAVHLPRPGRRGRLGRFGADRPVPRREPHVRGLRRHRGRRPAATYRGPGTSFPLPGANPE